MNIEKTLNEILARLEKVEEKLGLQPSPPLPDVQFEETKPQSTEVFTPSEPASVEKLSEVRGPKVSEITPLHSSSASENRKEGGGQWLGAVGILFFILAASFFIKLAIDSGWLTPVRQLGGVFLFGGLLNVVGMQLYSKDKSYASLLPAAGVVVLFMGTFAGHLYFGLYSAITSCALSTFVAFYSLFLFTLFRNEFFLVAAIVGTYAIPPLLFHDVTELFPLVAYFVIWDILFCVCAIVLEKRLLIGLTAYLALLVFYGCTAGYGMHAVNSETLFPVIFFQIVQFLLFSFSVAIYSMLKKQNLKSEEAWALFPILVIFYVTEYSLAADYAPQAAPGLAILFAVMLYAIYFMSKLYIGQKQLASEPVVFTFVAMALFHAVYLELIPDENGAPFAVGLMVVLGIFYTLKLPYRRYFPFYTAIFAVIGLEYLQVLGRSGSLETIIFQVIYAGAFAMGYFAVSKDNSMRIVVLWCAILQALVGSYHYSELAASETVATYLTSGLWAALAFATLSLAYAIKDRLLAKSSVSVFAIVALKVLLYDISSSNGIGKVVALLVVGALLYGAGMLIRQIDQWDAREIT